MKEIPAAEDFENQVHPATELLREVIQVSESFSKSVGEKLLINRTDFEAMSHLIDKGPLTAGELANLVGVTAGSATVMIDRLAKVGHITREPNPKDRRGVLVVASPESVHTAWQHISPLILASEGILNEMTDLERDAVEKYLRFMLAAYERSRNQIANKEN